MKKGFVLLFALLILPMSLASAALSVEKIDKGSVIISELDNPAVFDFIIQSDRPDTIEIFSLVGVSMSPRGAFDINAGNNTFEVRAFPKSELREREGFLKFEYQIKHAEGVLTDTLQVKIVPMEDALKISPGNFLPGDEAVNINITNLENTHLQDVSMTFVSEFFKEQKIVSLEPYESKEISVEINQEKARKIKAGPYIVTAEASVGKAHTRLEGVIQYLEKQGTSILTDSRGIIIRTTTTTKTNEGNVVIQDTIEEKRNIITRLFTTYSAEPESITRKGASINYQWSRSLEPGDSWSVSVVTNYTLPFLLILLVIVIGFFTHLYSRNYVTVTKRVNPVKTRGGQFALKVRLSVRAKSHVDNIQLVDRLPGVTKLYEKFGTKPERIDESTKRMFWNIKSLQAGEERVFSYILYADVNIVGTFELPAATAIYEKSGKTHESLSNRAFFANETAQNEE